MTLCLDAESIIAAREKHLREAANERRKFRHHMEKARTNKKYMSMIIDGMTQKTTSLPHFERNPAWVGRDELGVHVIGTIIQDLGIHLEFSYKNIGDNTNVLIDNIHKGVQRMHDHRSASGEPFPEVLYLQLDNVNHNKSKNLFTYLSYLVETEVFRKIKVNYFLVGHTHEIIDQVFSRYAVALRQVMCLDLESLMEVAKTCYTPNPTVEHVQHVTDWYKWFTENGSLNKSTADLKPNHAFRIKHYNVDVEGAEDGQTEKKVLIHSKTLGWRESSEDPKLWRPRGGHPVLLCLPQGTPLPQALIAFDDNDFQSLESLVKQFEKNLGSNIFKGSLKTFWLEQIEYQESVRDGRIMPDGFEFNPLQKCGTAGAGKHALVFNCFTTHARIALFPSLSFRTHAGMTSDLYLRTHASMTSERCLRTHAGMTYDLFLRSIHPPLLTYRPLFYRRRY